MKRKCHHGLTIFEREPSPELSIDVKRFFALANVEPSDLSGDRRSRKRYAYIMRLRRAAALHPELARSVREALIQSVQLGPIGRHGACMQD
jgi:hypothetical protein